MNKLLLTAATLIVVVSLACSGGSSKTPTIKSQGVSDQAVPSATLPAPLPSPVIVATSRANARISYDEALSMEPCVKGQAVNEVLAEEQTFIITCTPATGDINVSVRVATLSEYRSIKTKVDVELEKLVTSFGRRCWVIWASNALQDPSAVYSDGVSNGCATGK